MPSEQSPRSRKREYDHFEDLADLGDLDEPCSVPPEFLEKLAADEERHLAQEDAMEGDPTPPSVDNERGASPARSSTCDLTDAGSNTPFRDQSPMIDTVPSTSNANPPISAFSVLDGRRSSAAPPPKKQKLTFQEKELKKINKEIKEKERAEEKARKDAKTQQQAEEKARKEAERKKKEAEREEKRAAQEAEKVSKEEKRRKKEEEKQKAEEEKAKKERSQMKLGNFFSIPASASKPRAGTPDSRGRASMSPAPQLSNPSVASPASFTPSKSERTPYEKIFPEFFIQSGVTVAPITRFERDEEAIDMLQKTIDSYLSGDKTMDHRRPLCATEMFDLSGHSLLPRGKRFMSVREIMAEFYAGNSSRPIDLTTDSQNTQIKRTADLLRNIPLKYLRFQEDVRPPYSGTYTSRPVSGMTRLARNPLRRDLPETNYEYDSEAEWVEDEDEAGEDLKSDDEDEDVDDGRDDMDGFLDDEADETANSRRLVIQGDLEPISTGLCWEDRSKRSTNVKMMKYRMEVILDPKIKSIDPFSISYWQPAPITTSMEPPRLPLNVMKNTSVNVNSILPTSNKPVKSFFSIDSPKSSANGQASKDSKPKKLLSVDDLPAFKQAIVGSDLSKVGLIEVLKKQFPGRPAAAIKSTLEQVARRGRPGEKEKDKRWLLVDA